MFEAILVANRGEIACRIMATLRRMGIGTIAVYTDADAGSAHVRAADAAVRIGTGPVATSYLHTEAILEAAITHGAKAVHPGYGFLSENAAFAAACQGAGVTWIGPTPAQLEQFGDKHRARTLAASLGVPLLSGSGLLGGVPEALAEADRIGYPVMLKATAGGGGIGMQRCDGPDELDTAFGAVTRLAAQHFGDGGVFVERFVARARHVEVQIFGNGTDVVALGARDCSAQRRNQKVVEETPPVGLTHDLIDELGAAAVRLGAGVGYRSAGTVEYVVDAERGDASFLEVNTRLQVEHGVTEAVRGIDLVEWMVLEAAGRLEDLALRAADPGPGGAAIEVRVYAEDPAYQDRPSSGTISAVSWPSGPRVDTWVERGTEVTPFYDPLLAKIIVHGSTRQDAVRSMSEALRHTVVEGVATNLGFLDRVVGDAAFADGAYPTSMLATVAYDPPRVEVEAPGMQTTIQDHPGRIGYWAIGVPPSGPMDDRSFRLANRLVGNAPGTAALEMTFNGPALRFRCETVVALAGAPMAVALDGEEVDWAVPVEVRAGSLLEIGSLTGWGARAYLAVRGGFDASSYLGSRATFLLGGFGGHAGRALVAGDVVAIAADPPAHEVPWGATVPGALTLGPDDVWDVAVIEGPHGAPDFFTESGLEGFYSAEWQVHHHSDRTGVRLVGPPPQWARPDGGEAGLHPSNIHDNPYAIGAVDFTGDMPVILGPDGPSLGGFVCPATVTAADRWKLGQLRPGDRLRFRAVDHDAAVATARYQDRMIATLEPDAPQALGRSGSSPVLDARPPTPVAPAMTVRRSGDRCVLVEYGPNVLDLELRMRVHALMEALDRSAVPGVEELSPGIRSLQVRYDPTVVSPERLVDTLRGVDAALPAPDDMVVPSRIVHLPLSWDDPSTRRAIERYMQVVRDDAPWCPWNIEFIRRINGLDSVEDVRRIVFDASYVVLGLGDVYLGAPVATPLDPRHRLVTTKYNPARTWTPENAVGIGGAYMCIYGMEGPGGYQFVGRTLQVWNRYRDTPDFAGDRRWLLRFFDQIRFYPVAAEELADLRRDFALGLHEITFEATELSVAAYRRFLAEHAATIAEAKERQASAFAAEWSRWEASGELSRSSAPPDSAAPAPAAASVPSGSTGVSTPVHGVVGRIAEVGAVVAAGETLLVVEAMKTETAVVAPVRGTVTELRCAVGDVVAPGRPLVVVHGA